MGAIISPEILQKTLYDLDVSTDEKREQINRLVSHLQKSTLQFSSIETPTSESKYRIKRKIDNSSFLKKITKNPIVTENPEFEVIRREKLADLIQIPSQFSDFQFNPKPEMTLGPFPTISGSEVYFDFIRYQQVSSVRMSNSTTPILYISVKITRKLLGSNSIEEIKLPKGSVWINASYLGVQVPGKTFIGLKIKSGKINFRVPVTPNNGEIIINQLNLFSLELNLDNEVEMGNDDSYGLDAQKIKLGFSPQMRFGFQRGKLSLAQMQDVNVEVFGDSKNYQVSRKFQLDAKENNLFLDLTPTAGNDFEIRDSSSSFFQIEGQTTIQKSQWHFTTRVIETAQTIPVETNGYIYQLFKNGLKTHWKGLDTQSKVELQLPSLRMMPGYIMLNDEKAKFSQLTENYYLWQRKANPEEEDSEIYDMEANLDFSSHNNFVFVSDSKGAEMIGANADVDFLIDKPIQANGQVLAPKMLKSTYIKTAKKDNFTVQVLGANPYKDLVQKHQFVLENAFITTSPLVNLHLSGHYNSNNELTQGNFRMGFDLIRLIPSLPHPYTGRVRYHSKYNYDIYTNQYDGYLIDFGDLISICTWEDKNDFREVNVDFKMNQHLLVPDSIDQNYEESEIDTRKGFLEEVNRRRMEIFTLFDVSTKEDHLGVCLSFGNLRAMMSETNTISQTGENSVQIDRMNLRAPMTLLNGMTLPQTTWEPFINETISENPDDPYPGYLTLTNNQYPTVFYQTDNQYIKINPQEYIAKFQKNLKPEPNEMISTESGKEGRIFFSLPNGKLSLAQLVRFDKEKQTFNTKHLDFIQPNFDYQTSSLQGGIQYRISAYAPEAPTAPPTLMGMTVQLRNITNDIGKSVLSETVHLIFENVYNIGPNNILGVPVTHIDFSGYGASTFSDWKRPKAKYASIAQAKFNMIRGRLGHEIIQAVSMIYPYGVCATRTISFFRRNNSVIYREDSGWVAQSDGLFNFNVVNEVDGFEFDSLMDFHPGLFKGVYGVENIKEISGDYITMEYYLQQGDYYKHTPTTVALYPGGNLKMKAKFIGVTFDADALVENSEGFEKHKVTGKKFKGYLQIEPEGVPVPPRIMAELLERCGDSLGGNVDCEVNIAESGQRLKANRVDITRSTQNNNAYEPIFIGTVRGSVRLPKEGSWSMVEVDQSGNVGNLADDKNISIIREGLRKKDKMEMEIQNESSEAKIAFPDALLNTDIQKTYAILQNTENQKILFRDPFLKKGQVGKLLTNYKSVLADSFHLLDSKGPFPNVEKAIEILNDSQVLDVLPNSEGIKKVINYKLPDQFECDLVGKEGDPFRIYIKYESKESENTLVNYVTDSLSGGDKWKNEMNNLSILVNLSIFEPLLTITGDFQSGISVKPSLEKGNVPQLKFADELETIYQILEFLDELSMDKPVEAVKKGLKIAMSNSSDAWEYKFKASKEISLVRFPFDPVNYNSPTTPLKMEAFFRVGCYFNQPIIIPKTIDQLKPSAGAFMELGAELRVMCVSLAAATIYAVGKAEVGLVADLNNPPALYFKFGFGVELSVGLPVIGSVSIMYMVGIDIKINNNVVVGAYLYFRGRAEIAGGLVTITIAIEAKGSIKKIGNGPTNCIASCTFALDISVAFVINLSFTETWEEERQIS